MGRSKFPGKPSKHVNRTRINVLSAVVNINTTVAENNPSAVTVVESDDSKKVEHEDVKEEDIISENKDINVIVNKPRKCKKTRLSISNKCSPLKRTLLRSGLINSPLNGSTRLTRSKVTRRSGRVFTGNRKISKSPKKDHNLVGKFVLPSRSVHSSRVIKPNKRFLNTDQPDSRIIKTRFISKKQCNKSNEVIDCDKTENAEVSESSKEQNDCCKESPTNSKVVLRQARLQIKSKISMGTEGPFTKNITNMSSPQGNVTCGVCGTVRYYRFIKQARKFNIYSCELCRKFISMLIKRISNKTETVINCHKGEGLCHIPPVAKNLQSKYGRTVYNSRCQACWLKLCLRSFQMPSMLRSNLSQLLPKHMQINDNTFGATLPLMIWQSHVENNSILLNNSEGIVRQRPVRLKAPKKVEKIPSAPVTTIRRQVVDLKGPRVKHVCRSASIVLGQIPATFPTEKKNNEEKEKDCEKSPKVIINECINNKTSEKMIPVINIDEKDNKGEPRIIDSNLAAKREKTKTASVSSMLPIEITKPSFSKRTKKIMIPSDNTPLVNIDYWESYDPDEIISNGFSITASESFSMQAICFLCGSAGKETLLHCCICCEPYHPYCLEQGPPNFLNTTQKYTWICPKCTACSACGESDRQKINCQKCHKAYHPQCFNTKWRTDDRLTVCSNCLRCKSCGTDNITKFVGNLALCLLCFKLRNKGNYCPLCQCCYDDNDFDTKMMECGKCNKWVHAKCEGLSDEQYQILSILPETVEFQCCLCSGESTPFWKKAVQSELRSCFNNILRLFSKNRIARDTFKLSPFKLANPEKKRLSSARRLQFVENDETLANMEADNLLDSDLEQVNLIFNQKQDVESTFVGSPQSESKLPISPNMVEIRNKLNCNEYFSLRDFNNSMEQALKVISQDELLNIYKSILKKVFPWFDPSLKEELVPTVCDARRIEKSDEKQFSFDVFDPQSFNCIDTRMCNLCKGTGDGLSHKESRLLYCGQNDWVHANCALWSSEVYEEIDGSLQNVSSAVNRGRSLRCCICRQKGASVGCCLKGCHETYHFPCAIKSKCIFFADKSIFCKSHSTGDKTNVLSNSREFEIRRTVYIEIDNKKNKCCEPNKVKFMVGSLSVVNIGRIIPSISDNVDTIIPIGYICSRLFWSITEPWKLVPYRITTSILNSQSHTHNDKNFTIDHMLPKHIVEKKLKEILSWQRDEKSEINEFEEYEPQNGGDILSPEITEAILEEFPQDLLDGISVQDMLIECEELMGLDFKNAEINCNDSLSLNMNNDIKSDEYDENKIQIKRSKSDPVQKKEDKLKSRSQQRSCSLTWTQLDNTPVIKKRKITPNRDNMFMQLLQVDGACDSSSSECGSPTHESKYFWSPDVGDNPVSCEKCHCTYRTQASYKRHLESCEAFTSESETEADSHVTNEVNKSQLLSYETYSSYQSSQNQIHSTVMNTHTLLAESLNIQEKTNVYNNFRQIDSVKTSSNNVINLEQQISHNEPSIITQVDMTLSNPQILNQHCSSQENISLDQRFSANQADLNMVKNNVDLNSSIISLDNSEVLNTMNKIVNIQKSQQLALQPQPITIQTQPQQTSVQSHPQQVNFQASQMNLQPQQLAVPSQINLHSQNQITLQAQPQQLYQPQHMSIQSQQQEISVQTQNHQMSLQSQPQHMTLHSHPQQVTLQTQLQSQNQQIDLQSQSPQMRTLQAVPYSQEVQPVINLGQQNQAINMVNSVVNVPPNQWVRTLMSQNKQRVRPRIATKRGKMQENTIVLSQSSQPVFVQHIPTNMPFVDTAFSSQINPNVQYVATLAPQINAPVAPQPQLLQLGDNNFLSLVPNVQPTMIIQQPRVDTGQLILDSNGSMMWASQPVPQVQPVFYGFETIVQNTVLQSQQLLPSAMPGVLTTNSSYSATTQVFQTGKIEPVLDGSYVLVNPNQIVNQQQTIHVPHIQSDISSNITSQNISNQLPLQNKPNWNQIEVRQPHVHQPTVHQQPIQQQTVQQPVYQTTTHQQIIQPPPQIKPIQVVSSEPNSITLQPMNTYITDQGIPTKIVVPTPKPQITNQCRPMSRVLPMQTTTAQQKKTEKEVNREEKTGVAAEPIKVETVKKNKTQLLDKVLVKQQPTEIITSPEIVKTDTAKEEKSITKVVEPAIKSKEVTSAKIINKDKEKEECEVVTKINKVQIVPLKPIQTKPVPRPITPPLRLKELKDISPVSLNIPTEPQNAQDPTIEEVYTKPVQKNYKKVNTPTTCVFYKIESPDGIDYTSTSLTQLWKKLFNEVQAARLAHNLPPLPDFALKTINDGEILGLKMKGMKYLLEQLPDVVKCKSYKPVFQTWSKNLKNEEEIDDDGARRCVAYEKKQEKYDMFGWLSSKHRVLELYDYDAVSKKNASSSLPMAMRFRTLKVTSKYSVGVYRSEIHGRGLFSLRDIESGEMVIEYAGEVIRSILTDKREKFYNSKGIGCYMFRIDDNLVVDATMKGNAARFINHSCDPNCYSKVVEILGCKHIIIFALRKIISGEELTYDYKFPFEEDKIPCTCGTKRCRKFLN